MIYTILAALCASYYLVNVAMWHIPLQRAFRRHRVKPFDCVQCLCVWFAIGLYFAPVEFRQFVAVIFGTGVIGSKLK